MLKQAAFFAKLQKKNLKPSEYYFMFYSYMNPLKVSERDKTYLFLNKYFTDKKLNEEGIKLIEEIDNLFKPIKKIKSINLLGDDAEKNIDAFLELFPTYKLPNGKYARGNKKNIQENFMWFFQEYNYNWDVILKATETYVKEYQRNNYQYMRTAMYFIKKVIDGTAVSELANYCDIVNSSTDYIPERFIKTKVV
jgi:hypothetical protein